MPNPFYNIGKGFDRLIHCKRINPCFLGYFICMAGCAIGTGVIYLVKGPGEIVELALFCLTIVLVCVLFFSHAYYIRRPLQGQQPENV